MLLNFCTPTFCVRFLFAGNVSGMQAFRGIARTGEMTLWGTSSPLPHRARSKLVSSPALSTFPALGYFVALSRVLRFLSALGGHQAYVTLVLPGTGGSHSACGAAIQPIAAQLSRVAPITAAQLYTQRAATHTSSVNFIELTQLTISRPPGPFFF